MNYTRKHNPGKLTYSLPIKDIDVTARLTTDMQKIYIVKTDTQIFPVYKPPVLTHPVTHYEVLLDTTYTKVPWKFFGYEAIKLNSKLWTYINKPHTCRPILIRLHDNNEFFGFVVPIIYIKEENPSSSSKNKITKWTHFPVGTLVQNIIAASNGRPGDGYVIHSTRILNKPIKVILSFPSSRIPSIDYNTTVYNDGTVSCSCPSWTNRAERYCKHIADDQIVDIIKLVIATPKP